MCNFQIKDKFVLDKYTHLKNLLSKDECNKLVEQLKEFVVNKKTVKDSQCPTSEAIYGAPIFDSLLEHLTPKFEETSGKKLFPTYSYARLYAPGEELKIHLDRPACEISATITLGFEGGAWPIYMGDYANEGVGRKVIDDQGKEKWLTNESEIKMDIGDAILYMGQEKAHWREKYTEGQWQAQVFLHYVDANGPHAELKYDKKPRLSHHDPSILFWYFLNSFPLDRSKGIIEEIEKFDKTQAEVGVGVIDKQIRDVKRILLPPFNGLGAQMAGLALHANQQAWKFEVTHANQCEYLIYDIDGHYHAHTDTIMDPTQSECRKLTVLAFLNDDFEGGKLFLQNGHKKIYPPQNAGTILVFPSFILHGVEPVTKGIRRSIVTWIVGPWFK